MTRPAHPKRTFMAPLTLTALIAAGVAPTAARTILGPLQPALTFAGIDTPARLAAFVGQCVHESAGFTDFEENCSWSTAARIVAFFPSSVPDLNAAQKLVRNPQGLANTVYANRLGNGSVASGDGWRYRGRGAIQLTGRHNYADAAVECRRPYLEHPELVALPADALFTAAWFWRVNRLNALADTWQIDAITRVINGPAMAGHKVRASASNYALNAFEGTMNALA